METAGMCFGTVTRRPLKIRRRSFVICSEDPRRPTHLTPSTLFGVYKEIYGDTTRVGCLRGCQKEVGEEEMHKSELKKRWTIDARLAGPIRRQRRLTCCLPQCSPNRAISSRRDATRSVLCGQALAPPSKRTGGTPEPAVRCITEHVARACVGKNYKKKNRLYTRNVYGKGRKKTDARTITVFRRKTTRLSPIIRDYR